MLAIGKDGYMKAAGEILKTASFVKKGIKEMPDLYILGDPLWVIAFGSETLDIYKIMDYMTKSKWSLNGLHRPPCVHICLTLRHTRPGVAERFLKDLKSAVAYVKENPDAKGGMAPVYGMAATIPDRGVVGDLLDRYMDLLYKV
jgi:hypothetical protein